MFSFFLRKKQNSESFADFISTDMHSHLLPNLDDGSDSIEESLTLLDKFIECGYQKAIMTPHIMGDSYKNTPEGIKKKLQELKLSLKGKNIQLDAAAEYYIDETFYTKLKSDEEILSFGSKKYVLIETSYINEASYLAHVTFELFSKGFTPVLAHPERYTYMYHDFKKYEELFERGLLFQININSLVGYYSPAAQKIAEKLIDKKMIHFLGSDCHSLKHIGIIQKAKQSKYYLKLKDIPLLNNTL